MPDDPQEGGQPGEGERPVEWAVGALMAQGAEDAAAARRRLRQAAECSGRPLVDEARDTLDRAVRRAGSLPARIAATYSSLGEAVFAGEPQGHLQRAAEVAAERIPGADWASITLQRRSTFETVAASDPVAREVDGLQYEHAEGPCLAAIEEPANVLVVPDLPADGRWPVFAKSAAETGVGAILSFRLGLEVEEPIRASLNVYASHRRAFGDDAVLAGTLLAAHTGGALLASRWQDRAEHLQRALETNREIGVAMGILMHQHRISREAAFDLLRIASQHCNRKLHDIAVEVAGTGELRLPPGTPRSGRRPRD
jgi:hypothetical protein